MILLGELLLLFLAAIGALTLVCTALVVGWFLLAADREPLNDSDATLDVQNHWGDSRETFGDRAVAYRRWRGWDRDDTETLT